MKRLIVVAAAVFVAASVSTLARQSPSVGAAAKAQGPEPGPAFLKQYCIGCHNARVKAGNLVLDELDPAHVEGGTDTWEKVVRKLRTGMMPPEGAPRPASAARDAFASALEGQLDRQAMQHPDPGTPALHRLNRAEYANAIRDLLALDVDVAAMLPPDDSAAGFDNNADVLGVSPALIEGYASAAAKVSRLALGDPSIGLDRVTYRVPGDLAQDVHIDGLPLGTRGGTVIQHTFPVDAEYDLEVGAGGAPALGAARGAGPRGGGPGAPDDRYVTLDGERVTLQGRGPTRIRVSAGRHTIAAALVVRSRVAGVDSVYNAPARTPGVSQVTITGPFNATGPGDTPSRRRILVCTPASAANEPQCARTILNTLASRAYRRPIAATGPDVETLLDFYKQGREGGTFESGIRRAVARVLVDPQFLFRFEREPADVAPGAAFRLGDFELASRLSFFLWSSIPDEELLAEARRGTLKNPATLERQVRRMLADPRAEALVTNFAGQWLLLRELRNVRPDSPEWDGNLRQSFQRETEQFFRTIVQEDRSIIDLLDADFTFVDERLARHYGIQNVHGSRLRRVTLAADDPRRGLLGQGSILTVTSAANRTSPVTRGKWVLENVLGAPPPNPPPGVETNLEKDAAQVKATSLRQRMELHRSSPVCASCHRLMDPIGFSLENFDNTGKWRALDGKTPIDASGVMVDGSRLNGPVTLRQALLSHSDVFAGVFAERLLTYAAGRGLRPQDMPAVRAITRAATQNKYRFSSFVLGVVKSAPFQLKTKAVEGGETKTE
jgi:mono/diheme cytochrome c family protein